VRDDVGIAFARAAEGSELVDVGSRSKPTEPSGSVAAIDAVARLIDEEGDANLADLLFPFCRPQSTH
jgi:hypothetical protein